MARKRLMDYYIWSEKLRCLKFLANSNFKKKKQLKVLGPYVIKLNQNAVKIKDFFCLVFFFVLFEDQLTALNGTTK